MILEGQEVGTNCVMTFLQVPLTTVVISSTLRPPALKPPIIFRSMEQPAG